MARLRSYVHVPVGMDWVVYGPGDEVPAEHAALITNPKAWAEDSAEVAPEVVVDDTEQGSVGEVPAPAGSEAPPRAGKGSGRDAWAAFAESRGVLVEDTDSRDEIIAAVQDAGIQID